MKLTPELGMSLQAYFEQTSGRVPPVLARLLDESLEPAQLSPQLAAEWESFLNQSGAVIPPTLAELFDATFVLELPLKPREKVLLPASKPAAPKA